MKSLTLGGNTPKVIGGVSSPRKKEVSVASPQKLFQGSPRKMKVPLKPEQKPIKCYSVMVGAMGGGNVQFQKV